MRTHVLMVSRFFPCYHPKKGDLTQFVSRILNREKLHTIRTNYKYWKKKIDEVNEGKAVWSLRYWSSKPYKSEQVEFLRLTKAGIDEVKMNIDWALAAKPYLAKNDGLTQEDFRAWFKADKNPNFEGCIIYFTDFRYGS